MAWALDYFWAGSVWPRFIRCSGTKFYYYDDAPGSDLIYELDPAGPTETIIYDATVYGLNYGFRALAYFSGGIYAILNNRQIGVSKSVEIHKWSGVAGAGGNWSLVDTITSGGDVPSTIFGDSYLYSYGGYLVAAHSWNNGVGGDYEYTRYSSDGAVWGNGSWELHSGFGYIHAIQTQDDRCTQDYPYGIVEVFTEASAPNTKYVYWFNVDTGIWELLSANGGWGMYVPAREGSQYFTSNPTGLVTTDWTAAAAPPDTDPRAMCYGNMPWTPGLYDNDLYQWDGADWDVYSEIDAGRTFTNTSFPYMFRLSNNYPYIFAEDVGSYNRWEVWKSDTIIPDPPGTPNRMWIYKTVDGGGEWTSRGVQT